MTIGSTESSRLAQEQAADPAPREDRVNGWRVLAIPSQANEVAALAAFLPEGSARDPQGKAGAANLAFSLLQKGTKKKSALAFAEAVEDLGGPIGGSASPDFSKWSMAASSVAFPDTLDLWAEAFYESAFDPDEVKKERDLCLASLRMSEDNKFSCAYRRYLKELYAGTPYAEPSSGTMESVGALEREDLLERWKAMRETNGGLIVAVGNFDEDKLRARLEKLLVQPSAPSPEPLSVDAPEPAAEPVFFEKETEQAFLCVGAAAIPYAHEDYPALRVLSAVLGEGMGSRMFIRLRDEKGLAYDPGASLAPRRAGCHLTLYIGPNGDRLAEAREGIFELVEELRREPPTSEEMRRAKNYVAGRFLFDHQKNSRRANYLGFFEMMGVGRGRDVEFPALIEAVAAEQVSAAADKYLAKMLAVELRPSSPPKSSDDASSAGNGAGA